MARSLASNHEDKRQRILDEAAALFASAGFESARLQDVAAACNTSKSALYHYFPRKEDLLYVMLSEHIMSTVRELEAIAHGPGAARDKLAQLVRAMVTRATEKRNEHMVLTHDLKFLASLQQQEIRLAQARALEFVVDLLDEINPRLMRRRRERSAYALFLYGSMISTANWYRKEGGMAPQELADRMTDLFLKGFDGGDHPPGYT
jgi:AcrR family transcriptional regulator